MRASLAALLLMLAACGTATPVASHSSASASATPPAASPSSAVTSSPVDTPTPPSKPSSVPSLRPATAGQQLIAVIEAKGTANPYLWNTVAIAGLDGYARAKAVFAPMPIPYIGCGATLVPLPAHVAAGKVYFADGAGTIHSLSAHGQLAAVTSFPLTSSQQVLSFAVSPDGTQVLGSIVTLPPKPSPDPCAAGGGGGPEFASGDFSYAIYAATAGGPSRLLYQQDRGPTTLPAAQVVFLVGWDRLGPVGTTPDANTTFGSGWSSPGGTPGGYWGIPVRVDPQTGQSLNQVSDPTACAVTDLAPSGDFVCTPAGGSDFSVRHPDGSEIWGQKAPAGAVYRDGILSPAEGRVVTLNNGPEVFCWGVCDVRLEQSFQPAGWLDDLTVVGTRTTGTGDLAYVNVNKPLVLVDLGFKGVFVGAVTA